MTPSVYYSVRSSDITRQSTAAESGERVEERRGMYIYKGGGKGKEWLEIKVRRI